MDVYGWDRFLLNVEKIDPKVEPSDYGDGRLVYTAGNTGLYWESFGVSTTTYLHFTPNNSTEEPPTLIKKVENSCRLALGFNELFHCSNVPNKMLCVTFLRLHTNIQNLFRTELQANPGFYILKNRHRNPKLEYTAIIDIFGLRQAAQMSKNSNFNARLAVAKRYFT